MKGSQRGAAVAICVIGLVVVIVSAVVLISRLLDERAERKRLEEEATQLRQEIENLKVQPFDTYFFYQA